MVIAGQKKEMPRTNTMTSGSYGQWILDRGDETPSLPRNWETDVWRFRNTPIWTSFVIRTEPERPAILVELGIAAARV